MGVDASLIRSRGMTLIEVLVALAILAFTLAAGIKAAGSLTMNAQRMVDLSSGQWCAENHLWQFKLSRAYPPIGDSDFKCLQLGRRFMGHMVVRPTPNVNFRRVDVQVFDEAEQPIVKISTVMPRE